MVDIELLESKKITNHLISLLAVLETYSDIDVETIVNYFPVEHNLIIDNKETEIDNVFLPTNLLEMFSYVRLLKYVDKNNCLIENEESFKSDLKIMKAYYKHKELNKFEYLQLLQ